MRRRSSPTSYSRRVRNSSPSTAGAWKRTANGDALRSRPGAPGGGRSSWTRGQIVTSSGRADGPAAPREAERVGDRERDRAERVAAAPVRRDAVRGAGPLAAARARDEEARGAPAAVEHVGEQELGRVGRPGSSTSRSTRASPPTWTRCGCTIRSTARPASRLRTQSQREPEQAERDDAEDESSTAPSSRPATRARTPRRRASSPAGSARRRTASRYARPVAPGTATEREDVGEHVGRGEPAQLGVGGEEQAVLEHDRRRRASRRRAARSRGRGSRRARGAARCSASAPRGLAPSARSWWRRVASARSTM